MRKIASLGILLLTGMSDINAQKDTTKNYKISGDVDVYYRYNAGGYKHPDSYTSFTQTANSFELGMASIKIESSALSNKVDAVVDLGIGSRARDFSYNDSGTMAMVKQAFLVYNLSNHVKFSFGKMATHIGYESVDPVNNYNYSMSYMFTNGPFFHTGAKATFNFGKIEFSAGVADHFDQTISKSTTRDLIGQLAYFPNENWSYYLNYWGFYGMHSIDPVLNAKDVSQLDFVVSGKLSPFIHIGFNATTQMMSHYNKTEDLFQNRNWYGAAMYLNYDPNKNMDISLRSEYIRDKDLIKFTTKNITAHTLTLDYKIGPLNLMPELRYDQGAQPIFYDASGNSKKSTWSFIFAAIYKF